MSARTHTLGGVGENGESFWGAFCAPAPFDFAQAVNAYIKPLPAACANAHN